VKKFKTTYDVAREYGVSPVTVWRWIKKGKISATQTLGGHYRIEVILVKDKDVDLAESTAIVA